MGELSNKKNKSPFSITHLGYVAYFVTDLNEARRFYVDALGMVEVGRTENKIYLGGYEERNKFSFVLEKAKKPGLSHIAFHVGEPDDLYNIIELYKSHNLPVSWKKSKGGGFGFRVEVQDITGIPVEFYLAMEEREWMIQDFDKHHGANIRRIDHVNIMTPDVDTSAAWWREQLGFYCSEYTVMDKDDDNLWAIWLFRKPTVHDIAITNGLGPRLHHTAFYVQNESDIFRTCDILASRSFQMDHLIERGPARHGLSNAFFLYLRDPDGNRIELFTGDYLIPDPKNWKPKKWSKEDRQRATFWGAPPPASWFNEAMLVRDIYTGKFMEVSKPERDDRPSFVSK